MIAAAVAILAAFDVALAVDAILGAQGRKIRRSLEEIRRLREEVEGLRILVRQCYEREADLMETGCEMQQLLDLQAAALRDLLSESEPK